MRVAFPSIWSQRTRAASSAVTVAAVVVAATALVAMPGPAQAAGTQCQATYSVSNDWGSGFSTNVAITNLGAAWTSWTLGYSGTSKVDISVDVQ